MAAYLVQHTDDVTRIVDGADAYAPEGVLTTFFATRDARGVIDSWAERVASFRTAGIVSIERLEALESSAPAQGTYAPINASAHSAIDKAPATAYTPGSTRSCPSMSPAPAIASGKALVA